MKSTDDFSDLPISSRDVAPLILSGTLTDREGAGAGDDIDDESQLRAIRGVLVRNRAAEIALDAETERLDALAKRIRREQVADDLHYLFEVSIYQDAAHSMVAASLLAPFIEGVLHRAVRGIGRLKKTSVVGGRRRRTWQDTTQDIVEIGLKPYMPSDFDRVADALFLYRNKVLHCGLEWPPDDRNAFNGRLKEWPVDWFSMVTSNGVPVMFLMTPTFVRRCFVLADQIIGGLIAFENSNQALFADVFGTPPGWLDAYLQVTKKLEQP